MDARPRPDDNSHAQRATHVIQHLDGALGQTMLDAMSDVWSTLAHAATDAPSHARAVRARLFWESLAPGGVPASPAGVVRDLTSTGSDDAAEATDVADAA